MLRLLVGTCAVVPRVLPLHATMARAVLETWSDEAAAHDDEGRRRRLRRHRLTPPEEAAVCVLLHDRVTAVACLRRLDEGGLRLQWLETSHAHLETGTVLLHALLAQSDPLELSYETLDARWILTHTLLL